MVCLGADVLRMSVWNPVDPLPEGMPIVQIGQRDWEMGENYPAEIAIRCDVKETLHGLLPVLEAKRSAADAAAAEHTLAGLAASNWQARRAAARERLEATDPGGAIDPARFVMRLVDALPNDAVVVDEGILSSRPLLDFLPLRDRHGFFGLASGGIGFAIAGAIGIQLAQPERPVVAVIGDGSAMYGIQALWTAAHLELPITYVIANNRSYRILKERLVAFHANDRFTGMDLREPAIDFGALAGSLGVPAERVTEAEAIGPALAQALASGGPRLLDVAVDDGFTPAT